MLAVLVMAYSPIGLAACHIADARVKHVGLDSIAAASELTLRRCRLVSFITRPRWIDGGPHSFALYRQALQDQGRVINFYCFALNAFASSHSGLSIFKRSNCLCLRKLKMGFAVCEAFKIGMRFVWSKRQVRFARCGRVRNEQEGLSSCSWPAQFILRY